MEVAPLFSLFFWTFSPGSCFELCASFAYRKAPMQGPPPEKDETAAFLATSAGAVTFL